MSVPLLSPFVIFGPTAFTFVFCFFDVHRYRWLTDSPWLPAACMISQHFHYIPVIVLPYLHLQKCSFIFLGTRYLYIFLFFFIYFLSLKIEKSFNTINVKRHNILYWLENNKLFKIVIDTTRRTEIPVEWRVDRFSSFEIKFFKKILFIVINVQESKCVIFYFKFKVKTKA